MKLKSLYVIIFLITCLLLSTYLISFETQSKPINPDLSPDYVQMTKILHRFNPGVDYTSLHSLYRIQYPPQKLSHNLQYSIELRFKDNLMKTTSISGLISHVLILVEEALYSKTQAKQKIDRYAQDIANSYQCKVTLETIKGGTPEEIRALLQGYYYQSGLSCAVFIGHISEAWYEVPNDHYWWEGGYGYANWICDLFYMDLDGEWIDSDGNGIYDIHTNGNGDIYPEIFIGHIDPSTMSNYGNKEMLLSKFLDKDHNYWQGNIRLMNYGLIYIDHDWKDYSTYYFRHLYGEKNYDNLKWTEGSNNLVEKFDYLRKRLPNIAYGFTQVWVHSTWESHSFHTGGICYEYEIHESLPRALGYNIDGCHACDWAAGLGQYFIGGGYIYNSSPTSLVVIGTTKVGGMLAFETFYISLGKNNPIGRAFFDWMTDRLKSDEERDFIIGWHYGMTIIGDPLVCFLKVPGKSNNLFEVLPPVDFRGEKVENRSLLMKETIHTFSWKPNSDNNPDRIYLYRLYEVKLNSLDLIAEIPSSKTTYFRRGVEDREYLYALCSVDTNNRESNFSFTIIK